MACCVSRRERWAGGGEGRGNLVVVSVEHFNHADELDLPRPGAQGAGAGRPRRPACAASLCAALSGNMPQVHGPRGVHVAGPAAPALPLRCPCATTLRGRGRTLTPRCSTRFPGSSLSVSSPEIGSASENTSSDSCAPSLKTLVRLRCAWSASTISGVHAGPSPTSACSVPGAPELASLPLIDPLLANL